MNILVTLNSGLGADTGPNFNLTADVGSVTPSTATKGELLAGKFVDVNASATQITVTSTGTCTTSIVLNIVGQTTTTTTLAASSFVLGYDLGNFFTACTNYSSSPTTYYSTTAATLQVGTTLYNEPGLTTKVVPGFYSNGTDWFQCNINGVVTATGSCSTTSTTTSTSTSTSTSTTTEAPTTTTTSTSTTLPPETFSLGYSATTDWQACFAAQTNYYSYTGDILQNGLNLFTDITLSTKAPSGWYSNGSNIWYIAPICIEYTFTNNTGFDNYVDYIDCNGTSQQIYVYDGTTSTAVCVDTILNLRSMTANNNGAGSCPPSTTGVFQDETPCPTTTTTSTTSTTSTSTSTSTSTTSTSTSTSTTTSTSSTTSTTTAAPTSTTTSTSSTTSTTTQPGDTSTTTTSTTAAPTSTSTSTSSTTSTTTQPGDTSTTTTSTTAAPTSTTTTTTEPPTTTSTSTTTTTTEPPITTTSTSTSTSTSTTTLGTTAAPTVDITITNSSLDVPIGSMTINGVNVDWVGYGPDFVLSASDNGSFTSTQTGTQDVVIGYGGHITGQRITFYDSNNFATCQTLNGSVGTFTITGATITAGTTISVVVEDGICP